MSPYRKSKLTPDKKRKLNWSALVARIIIRVPSFLSLVGAVLLTVLAATNGGVGSAIGAIWLWGGYVACIFVLPGEPLIFKFFDWMERNLRKDLFDGPET